MEKINEHILSDKISTHIREGFKGWQVGFTVQQQTFYLQAYNDDTWACAIWSQDNLDHALNKLISGEYETILP